MRLRRSTSLLACATLACAAGAGGGAAIERPAAEAFQRQWYAGTAELTRYELEQWRYGEQRSGDAVLIFVTEDFLPDLQVKYEGRDRSAEPVSVLKLNFTREFQTGIYPYSILTSVFTPVGVGAKTLKVSSSVQEWCGHTYEQLNLRDGHYEGRLHSYFEAEADRELRLDAAMPEDAIWTRIRIDPSSLPIGEIELIPGLQFARLTHRPTEVERAVASLTEGPDGSVFYEVAYRELPRKLRIRFETSFPHAILEWEEHEEGDRVTRGVRTHSIMTDYWNRNAIGDADWRRRLGLD